MIVEFDPTKDEANRAKHGLSLADGEGVFADPDHVIVSTFRSGDGEERSKVIGLIGERLHTAVFVRRDEAVRFISVRKSNGPEARTYTGRPERP